MSNQTIASPACQLNLPFDSLSSGKERGKLYQNRDWLYQKYVNEKLSAVEIARLIKKSNSTIYRFLRNNGIKIRTRSESRLVQAGKSISLAEETYHNRNWLYQKYWVEKLSTPEISKLCDINKSTIATWIKKLNLKSRNHSESVKIAKNKPSYLRKFQDKVIYRNKKWLYEKYWIKSLDSVQIAKIVGTGSNVIMAWLRKNKIKIKPKGENQRGKRTITKEHKKLMEQGRKRGIERGTFPWIKKGQKRQEWEGKNNPNYGGKYTKLEWVREKISKANKGRKIGEEEMQRRIKSWNIKPSGLEKLFNKITPNIIRYVGDGSWWRRLKDGHYHNPDFKVTGQNKVIEIWGDYWHRNDNAKKLISLYKQAGLDCLIIRESEFFEFPTIKSRRILSDKHKKNILKKVNKFVFT